MDLSGYQRVLLPIADKFIYQSRSGQPVTDAAAFLQRCVVNTVADDHRRVLDMGCGNGIIGIMLGLQRPRWQINGIDVQPELVDLARINAEVCNVHVHFTCGDLRQPPYPEELFDLIVANPPWIKMDAGIVSSNRSRALARTELLCSMGDMVNACQYLLRRGGSAYVLYPRFRSAEFSAAVHKSVLDINKILRDEGSEKYCVFHIIKR